MSAALDVAGLRAYQPDDLERVLRFVGECCAASDFCGCLHPGDVAHFLSNTLRGGDPSERVCLCTDAGSRPVALLLIYPAKFSGFDLVLAATKRGSLLEHDLIAFAESVLTGQGQSIASDVMDCDDSRRNVLLDIGYVPGDAPSMNFTARPLDLPIPDSILPNGFSIRSAADNEDALLSAAHSGAFNSSWPPGEYRKVMSTPGFEIDRELVVVAPDGRFAAFTVYWVDPVSRSGLFEPVGCHPDFQRRGLTQALMYEGMRRMSARGARTAIVKHLTDNPASTALYASVGFRPKYALTTYRKSAVSSQQQAFS